jgi:hypothetical protein
MNLILLRQGSAAKSRRSSVYSGRMKDRDDIYVLLWEAVCRRLGCCGEVWWVGWDDYDNHLTATFVERGMRERLKPLFGAPTAILARGAYSAYRRVFEAFPGVPRAYYGAGKAHLPPEGVDYRGVLLDNWGELEGSARKFDVQGILLKPAPESIFYPRMVGKNYDVALISSTAGSHKGFHWASLNVPKNLSILRIGFEDKWFKTSGHKVFYTGWLPREEIPGWACQARVCAITSEPGGDSNPRVASEALAMGLPIVVRSGFALSWDDYISESSGEVCMDEDFPRVIVNVVQRHHCYSPRDHYFKHLSMERASDGLAQFIKNLV